MFKRVGVAAMAILLAFANALAQSAPSYFKLSSDPRFSEYRPALIDYLHGRHYRKATRFCVFGTRDDSGTTATVIWPAGQQIIDWGGNDSALADSTSIVHLKTDVVRSEDQLHGSSYLVTRKWVSDQETICQRTGETVRIGAADLER